MLSVLIVDDSSITSRLLTKIVSSKYLVAGIAYDGLDAVAKYKELKPTAVIMDIHMPTYSGFQALEQIKSFDPNARVIMCSATASASVIAQAVRLGASGFIAKPFSNETVLETLNKALGGVLPENM